MPSPLLMVAPGASDGQVFKAIVTTVGLGFYVFYRCVTYWSSIRFKMKPAIARDAFAFPIRHMSLIESNVGVVRLNDTKQQPISLG